MPPAAPSALDPDDPNRGRGGAHQRVGRFWIEEPRWFWAAFVLIVLVGALALTLAILGDPP